MKTIEYLFCREALKNKHRQALNRKVALAIAGIIIGFIFLVAAPSSKIDPSSNTIATIIGFIIAVASGLSIMVADSFYEKNLKDDLDKMKDIEKAMKNEDIRLAEKEIIQLLDQEGKK